MKYRSIIAVAALSILPVFLYSIPGENPAPDIDVAPEPRELLDVMAPLSVKPDTGEIINVRSGQVLDNPVLNGREARQKRLDDLAGVRDPIAKRKSQKPTYPENVDLNVVPVDITNPKAHTAAHRAKEKAEERKDRELGEMAILNPAGYLTELARIRSENKKANP